MEFHPWFWQTAIGIAGIAVMFFFVREGTRRKGPLSHFFIIGGVVVGGAILSFAVDPELLKNLF